jgi:hypothetical protein
MRDTTTPHSLTSPRDAIPSSAPSHALPAVSNDDTSLGSNCVRTARIPRSGSRTRGPEAWWQRLYRRLGGG